MAGRFGAAGVAKDVRGAAVMLPKRLADAALLPDDLAAAAVVSGPHADGCAVARVSAVGVKMPVKCDAGTAEGGARVAAAGGPPDVLAAATVAPDVVAATSVVLSASTSAVRVSRASGPVTTGELVPSEDLEALFAAARSSARGSKEAASRDRAIGNIRTHVSWISQGHPQVSAPTSAADLVPVGIVKAAVAAVEERSSQIATVAAARVEGAPAQDSGGGKRGGGDGRKRKKKRGRNRH